MMQPRIDELAALADHAHAAGHSSALLAWWCDVASVALALAVRARGAQGGIGQEWFAMLPPESTCCDLLKACNAATRAPLTADARAALEALRAAHVEGDPVVDTTRLLADAAIAVADQTLQSASRVTRDLLASTAAIAAEFDACTPRGAAPPAEGEPDRQFVALPIGNQPAFPRVGQEVEAAIAHCAHLAYHKLGRGP
jgi:hypothetical protein